MADNQFGDAGLAALLGAGHLSGLRTLSVAQNGITGAGATLLGSAPPEIERLNVSSNDLGPDGATALAAALPRMRLKALQIDAAGLGSEGLARVIQAGRGLLTQVGAARNDLGSEGAARLGSVPEAASVRRLDLAGNALGANGIAALGRSPYLKNLRQLGLDSNEIGDEGGVALEQALDSLPNLEELQLQDNDLGPIAAAAIATSPLAARLLALGLAHNRLGDAGAAALAHGPGWYALRLLDLERNGISLGAAASLLTAPNAALLTRVNFTHNALAGQTDLYSLTQRKVALLESSFAKIAAERADFSERFYGRLFARYPAVKPLFANVSMRKQQQHLMDALATVIDNLRQPEAVEGALLALGRRHVDYGAAPSYYHAVTSTLIATIKDVLGAAWSEELDEAWQDGLEAVTAIMLQAHRERDTATP